LQQFKIQQEQLIRAQQQQQQEKLRLQQENAMRAAANYSNSNIPFKPYLKVKLTQFLPVKIIFYSF
jgi:hypothetical protein